MNGSRLAGDVYGEEMLSSELKQGLPDHATVYPRHLPETEMPVTNLPPPTLLGIIGLIYEAASDVSRWREFLQDGARYFSSFAANLIHIDRDRPELSLDCLVGFEGYSVEEQRLAIQKQMALEGEDPRFAYARTHPNKPFRCVDLLPYADFHATRVYRELHQPYGIEYCLMVQYAVAPANFAGLAFFRGPLDLPYSEEDASRLGELVPHLRRALAIQRQLTRLDHRLQASYQTLETLPLGVVIADEDGLVEFANGAAKGLCELHDGIGIQGKRLRLTRRDSCEQILATIRRVVAGGEDGAITLPRPSGKPDFQCLVTRLVRRPNTGLPELFARPQVALYLSDPEHPVEAPEQLLQTMFGLTLAEAGVLERLLAGRTPEQAAVDHKVGISTVRSQLKSLFAKTNTSRQPDLIHRVLASPLWIARRGTRF